MSGGAPPSGLLASLRRLLATALEIAQVRLELLAVELEQEKLRIFDGLLWGALALLLLGVGLLLAVALLVLAVAEGHRLAVLAVLCGLFLAGGVALVRLARARLSSPGGVAAGTLGELARDRDALTGRE